MSYEVKTYSKYRKDIPKDVQEEYSYSLEDERTVLVIYHNGEPILSQVDGGEPEDATFGRDYSWIKGALLQAYTFGQEDRGN